LIAPAEFEQIGSFICRERSMNKALSPAGVSDLRQRFIEDMILRGFGW
jgi:hypothetical protein